MKIYYKTFVLRIIFGMLLFNCISISNVLAQYSGTYYIPSAYGTPNFANIQTAISELNIHGVGSGGVTFLIQPGYTESFSTSTQGLIQVATNVPTAANPVVFKNGGTGNNPVIIQTSTTANSGGITICGTSYVTFDGINITCNNSATILHGYLITRASVTQGSQHITIKNCTIKNPSAESGSSGIFQSNLVGGTQMSPTSTAGTNSYNSYYGDTIIISTSTNAQIFGIRTSGGNTALDATLSTSYYDSNNNFGMTGQNPNVITVGSGNQVQPVLINAQQFATAANNIIRTGTNNAFSSNAFGIILTGGLNTTVTVTNNDISLQSSVANTSLYGIYMDSKTISVTVSDNIIHDCQTFDAASTVSSGYLYCIYNIAASANSTINILGNTISNNKLQSTQAGPTFEGIYISNTSAAVSTTVDHNVISGNASIINQFTGIDMVNNSAPSTSNISIHDNQVYNDSSQGALSILATGGNVYGIQIQETFSDTTLCDIYNNSIYGLSSSTQYETGGATVAGIYIPTPLGGLISDGTVNIHNNVIDSLTGGSVAGGTLVAGTDTGNSTYGINLVTPAGAGTSSYNIYANWIYSLSGGGNGIITPAAGIYVYDDNGQTVNNIYNNFVADIKSTGDYGADGIDIENLALTTNKLYFNSIYLNQQIGASAAGTFYSAGIYLNGATNPIDMRNNLVVNTSNAGTSGKTIALYTTANTTFGALASTTGYNCYYAAGAPNLIYYNNAATDPPTCTCTGYTDLSSYQAASGGKDANSIEANPGFTSSIDLHLKNMTNPGVLVAGTPLGAPYNTDIDGDIRSTTLPYIGADENSVLTLSKELTANNNWIIYPVPFADNLFIDNKEPNKTIENIKIYDVLGRIMVDINTYQGAITTPLKLNASELTEGLYFLKITTTGVDYVQRVIKQ